jgi:hypothetical protein
LLGAVAISGVKNGFMTQTARLLLTWAVLFLAGLATLAGVGLAYGNVDLRLTAVAGALAIPLVQTVAFWAPGACRRLWAVRDFHSPVQPLLLVALINDVAALALIWGAGKSFLQAETALKLCSWYIGVRAVSAGAALAFAGFPRLHQWRARFLIGVCSLSLLFWGFDYFSHFLTAIPGLLFPDYSIIWSRLLTWSPLFVAASLAIMRLERLYAHHSLAAGVCLAIVPLCALTSVTVIAIDVFNTPDLALVSRRLLASLGLLAVAAIWHAVWFVVAGSSASAAEPS